jgi:Trypsin
MVGYGGVADGSLPRYLQWGNFRVLYDSEMHYNDEMIVFQPRDAGSNTYIRGGDSGGPMFLSQGPTLIGINVMGFWVNNIEYQGSTRVTSFLKFINEVTGIPIRN